MFGPDKTGDLKRGPAPDIRLDRTGRRADLYHRRDKRIDEEMQDMNNDLISREAWKNLLLDSRPDDLQQSDINFFTGDIKVSLKFVLNLIDNAPTVELTELCKDCRFLKDCETCYEKLRPQGEWIPISERLPEALQSVLVTSKSGRVYTSYIAHGDWEYGGEVIAWQPLPEPYKKGGAE